MAGAGTTWRVERVAEVDSTNRVLLDRARAGERAGVVLVADHQTAGRGRLDRSWVAPPGSSLLVSVLLRPAVAAGERHLLTVAMALAAAAASGHGVAVKWPNDLVADDRKVAGILAEVAGDAVVVGIGINVNWPSALPPEIEGTATALNHLAGHDLDRESLLADLLAMFARRVDALESPGGAAATVASLRERCVTLGRRVRVELPGGATIIGTADDIADDGRLVVRDDDAVHAVAVGDVVHVRPVA